MIEYEEIWGTTDVGKIKDLVAGNARAKYNYRSLGYNPLVSDRIVDVVRHELAGMCGADSASRALKIWGWHEKSLTTGDHYRIARITQMHVHQRNLILNALDRLEKELTTYSKSSTEIKKQLSDLCDKLEYRSMETLQRRIEQDKNTFRRLPFVSGVIGFTDTEVAVNIGESESLDMGITVLYPPMSREEAMFASSFMPMNVTIEAPSMSWDPDAEPLAEQDPNHNMAGADYWRLKDNGYPKSWIPDSRLYDLVDMALAIQAELQLQCLLIDREFTRLIQTRGHEYDYLLAAYAKRAAEDAAAEAAKKAAAGRGFWSWFGDILGIISAVAGVLALIPIFTPIAGPIAIVAAVGSLGGHTVDAAIKGDWDFSTIVGLASDALAALPFVGAVAKSMKAGKAAMKTIGGVAGTANKARVVTKAVGRNFLIEVGRGSGEASKAYGILGEKAVKYIGKAGDTAATYAKIAQGSVTLTSQIPLVVELNGGKPMTTSSSVAGYYSLAANWEAVGGVDAAVGAWDAVGTAATKVGTATSKASAKLLSLKTFANVIAA